MRKRIIAANWKMNGARERITHLLQGIRSRISIFQPLPIEVIICPPVIYIEQVERLLTGSAFAWGAQNVHHVDHGAHTGEISAPMLREFGCTYVIVGHSERRHNAGETDDLIAKKFVHAQKHGLIPILCVGETRAERTTHKTSEVVLSQLEAVLSVTGIAGFQQAVVAYEPVWAIGNGVPAHPKEAEAVHHIIRDVLARQDKTIANQLPILYGGSVNGQNIAAFLAMPDIDGVLVGGASLKLEEFCSMIQHAMNHNG